MNHRDSITAIAMMLSLASLAGCGGTQGPPLGKVDGQITVNGKPVSGLTVFFLPESGVTSVGATDKEGRFSLSAPGGQIGTGLGKNIVRVQGRDPAMSKETLKEIAAGLNVSVDELLQVPLIPPKYNEKSELSAEIQTGTNDVKFDLTI